MRFFVNAMQWFDRQSTVVQTLVYVGVTLVILGVAWGVAEVV